MTKKKTNLKPHLITTTLRGVFMGYIDPDTLTYPSEVKNSSEVFPYIEAHDVRMCVKWTEDMHGLLGLAAMGPSATCRVSPAVPKVRLEQVSSIMEVSKEAEKKWKKQPWG